MAIDRMIVKDFVIMVAGNVRHQLCACLIQKEIQKIAKTYGSFRGTIQDSSFDGL